MSRVLVVEDELHLAQGLRFNLEAEGYSAEVAGDGESATERLLERKENFDAVVLDIMLPGKDGFAVVSELRAARNLKHVEVAIAIAGVEGLDGYGEQEITLPQMTNALSLRSMAHTIDLMQRMRHVISEGGLVQGPGAVCLGERRQREKHED